MVGCHLRGPPRGFVVPSIPRMVGTAPWMPVGWGTGSGAGRAANSGALCDQICLVINLPGERKQIVGQVPRGWKLQPWASFAGRSHIKFPCRKEGERLLWVFTREVGKQRGALGFPSFHGRRTTSAAQSSPVPTPSLSPRMGTPEMGWGVNAGCCHGFASPILPPSPWQCLMGRTWSRGCHCPPELLCPRVGWKQTWECGTHGGTLVWWGWGQAAPCMPPTV